MLLNTQNINEITDFLNTLSFNNFKNIVEQYSNKNNANFDTQMENMVTMSLQSRLNKLDVNCTCPKCNSSLKVKNGKRKNSIQEYKCKKYGSKFTDFSNTILEKTRWHRDIWVKVLEMTINSFPINKMINVLENDYDCTNINEKTVWLWKMKLIHSIASLPMPKLTGVIQVDETFIRESQKGIRELVSYINGEKRTARYGKISSKYGVMGTEFATVTTAIDSNGYFVCKVTGLGKLTNEIFINLFSDYFDNPSYICSDGNLVYEKYCEIFNIPHYIKPSNYSDILLKNGYDDRKTVEDREKLILKLFNNDLINKITYKGKLNYIEFKNLKTNNKLSLARVNELHKDLKKFIYTDKTNVSTKYLEDYIGFFTYLKNWKVRFKRYPSSKKDIEQIFEEILTTKVNYTINDIKLDLPKPSGKYVNILIEETKKAREITGNKYFKFNEEDGVVTFNKRKYLLDIPRYKLYNLCREYNIKRFRKLAMWSIVTLLLKQSDIDIKIYQLLEKDRYLRNNVEKKVK
mgnify:FL=1